MLDQVLAAEREQLAGEDGDDARLAEMTLDELPPQIGSAVRELSDYAWHSDEARAGYQQIQQMLQREVLDAQFAGMKQALAGDDPEAMQRVRDMLADLNQLLADHARGVDTPEQFDAFMDQHGEFFPEQPSNVEELIDSLARRQAAAERMMRSLSREQRAELAELMQQALGDVDLQSQLAQLQDNLSALRPGMMRGGPVDIDGDEPLGYGDAVGAVSELADLEALEQQLGQDYPGATLDDIDVDALERQLPARDVADLETLRRLEAELERQGYLRRDADGLALTPKALRRLGESALRRIFAQLDAQARGDHDDQRSGAADERTGAFLPWRFGDERPIDAVRTVQNAVLRRAAHQNDDEAPARLDVDDFAVAETERRTTAAVALCVDLSFSMVQEGRWRPMKQTALALAHLISTRFRNDALEIIGFDRTARRLSPLATRRGRARVGPGHEPAARAQDRRPSPAPAPRRRARRAGRDRWRADRAPRRRRLPALPLAADRRDGPRHRRRGGRDDPARRHPELLPARRRPGAGPLRRRGCPPQRWPGAHAGERPARASTSSLTTSGPAAPLTGHVGRPDTGNLGFSSARPNLLRG